MKKIYLRVIRQKTAKLFEASSLLSGVINSEKGARLRNLSKLGECFGMIFQITDDILDYSGNETEIGKNIGDDLAEGKITLPLIYAIKKGSKTQSNLIKNSIKMNKINELPNIIAILEETKAIELVRARAKDYLLTIEETISELAKTMTIVIVTHNMQQAARVSDYTAYMYLGDLVEFGDTEQVFFKPKRKETEDYITGRFG